MYLAGADPVFKYGGGSHQSKVGVHIRHTITKGVGGHAPLGKNKFW